MEKLRFASYYAQSGCEAGGEESRTRWTMRCLKTQGKVAPKKKEEEEEGENHRVIQRHTHQEKSWRLQMWVSSIAGIRQCDVYDGGSVVNILF